MIKTESLGARGEKLAQDFLRAKGYHLVDTNYRCRLGEIDIVAKKGGRLVFVEIKTRRHERFGRPEESVHIFKQRKLIKLALWYLKAKRRADMPFSFDVVAVVWKDFSDPEIRHIENAFEAGPGIG